MALIGYGRVSTKDQNAGLQRAALLDAGCEKLFIDDGASGKAMERPELKNALTFLRTGDTLVVWKLDRLGRSTRSLLEFVDDELKAKGVEFRSLTESIDTNTVAG